MVWGAFRAKIIVKDTGVSTGGSRKGKNVFNISHPCHSPFLICEKKLKGKIWRQESKTEADHIFCESGWASFLVIYRAFLEVWYKVLHTPYVHGMHVLYTHIHTLTNYHRTIRYWEYYTKCYLELMSHKQEILKIVWLLFIC